MYNSQYFADKSVTNANLYTFDFGSSSRLQITFPEYYLVQGVYWTTYTMTNQIGYLKKVSNVLFSTPSENGNVSQDSSILNSLGVSLDGGASKITYYTFKYPLITNQLTFKNIEFLATSQDPSQNYAIPFSMEFFGCDSFDVQKGN